MLSCNFVALLRKENICEITTLSACVFVSVDMFEFQLLNQLNDFKEIWCEHYRLPHTDSFLFST
jgi:hypothetical protein